jgi:hypothetical protein
MTDKINMYVNQWLRAIWYSPRHSSRSGFAVLRSFRKIGTPCWGSTPPHISLHIGRK